MEAEFEKRTRQREELSKEEDQQRKYLRSLINGEEDDPHDQSTSTLDLTPRPISQMPPMTEVDEVDEFKFVPLPLPPLPSHSPQWSNDATSVSPLPPLPPLPPSPPSLGLPNDNKPTVGSKAMDPSCPFRHAGLMREIGGADGFMKVVRGTHQFPNDSSMC